jgi:hypothetical protein
MGTRRLVGVVVVAIALAVPAGTAAHPMELHSGGLIPELTTLGLIPQNGAKPVRQKAPPATFDTSANMRFEAFSARPATGSLSEANSDTAFQGSVAYQGTFPGFRIVDFRRPTKPQEIINYTDCRHPAGQGDVVVYGDVLTRSWDSASVNGMPAGGWSCGDTVVPPGGEGLHVFDISDPRNPDVAAFIDLPCGSHTATGVPDPANDRLIVYSTPSNGNCDGIDVITVPLSDPSAAAYDHFEPSADLIACHDTGVILGDVLRAACAGGQGFAVWSLDPADGGSLVDPALLYTKNMKVELGLNINTGHSAAFSNDGETLIFGHEPDGGVQARCQATGTPLPANNDPNLPNPVYPVQTDDMKSFFFFDTETGALKGRWTLTRAQSNVENCTLHNYNVVPTADRDILVHGSYQSGIGVLDFTDLNDIREIGFADPKPINPNALAIGGDWSSYFYNGRIYESDITRGLLTWRFTGNAFEDAERLRRLNPQTQEFTTD